MDKTKTVVLLFQEEPGRWGLRGDPHLWREMRDHFERVPLPGTADELSALVETAFEQLTGHSISADNPFFIERFNHGGMSGGYISPNFWQDQALPLLRARYKLFAP